MACAEQELLERALEFNLGSQAQTLKILCVRGYLILRSEETQQAVGPLSICLLDPEPERTHLGLTDGARLTCTPGLFGGGSSFVPWMAEVLVMMAPFIDIESKTQWTLDLILCWPTLAGWDLASPSSPCYLYTGVILNLGAPLGVGDKISV